ncbi:nucleotide disphospho-sugar-binding domain-containing protein [Paenibacillus sp. UNC499MF]|uniref:glycosyltransferase n=1 Tax=Paenibacillus sp. UNC499MF TaxID=1502751 RepID=UPI0008A03EA9|nr:nucleotide disphospho-sugar-binding domain-containing protein [Paenibacillus sp. UNC499MF]SEG51716.1 UDP:flavonoid glycosyltransferase YjiC, YdhE family [Paenibacillus sp. UNC499MF]
MKITLLAYGKPEAVQPFAALASALKSGGYEAGVAVSAGSDLCPAHSGTGRAWMHQRLWRYLGSGEGGLEGGNPGGRTGNLREVCAESDLIVSDLRMLDHALAVSSELNSKLMAAALTPPCPVSRNAALLSGILRKLPFFYGAAGKREPGYAWPLAWESALNKTVSRDIPVLHAYSACFLERRGESGGPAGQIVTGEWRMAAGTGGSNCSSKSREDTGQWLDKGETPLYFGFSGLPLQVQVHCIQNALDASRELSCRAVIEADWQALGGLRHELPVNALPVEQADYDRLFPRCRSVLHRGSSAAAHASLRAGIPALVCPAAEEEQVWGRLTVAAGAGGCLPLNKVTRKKLTQRLKALEDKRVRNKTAELGASLREENGIETAIPFIDRYLSWTQYRKF